jgi:hypothetical protein
MTRDLIGKSTHNEFRDLLVGYSLCEFLLESYEYQQKQEERRAS